MSNICVHTTKLTHLLEEFESIWGASVGILVRMDDYISNNVRHVDQYAYSREHEDGWAGRGRLTK